MFLCAACQCGAGLLQGMTIVRRGPWRAWEGHHAEDIFHGDEIRRRC